ncbi:plasmid mobilization protein [Halalkalicoccus subterraneus]|uniref:plasmid mobilization protein n=1 Tax=Halalkalicoccus subterraneus TaxID=2675002 RepID=UPI0013CE651E|nr:hypothetical protein [Halalkalicoccus subterraneus]
MSDNQQSDTSRNKPVTMYYTADEKAAIKREANDAGKTVSTYCRDLVERQRTADDLEQLDAEARLERVMAEGTDRVEEIAEDVREQNGLVIHLLREIEDQLDGVDLEETDNGTDTDDDNGSGSGKAKSVDELL